MSHPTAAAKDRTTRFLSGAFRLICLAVYVIFPKPKTLVLLSGAMQAIMLPMIAFAALCFRCRRCDRRIMPGKLWDGLLWISVAGLFIAGAWAAWDKGHELIEKLPAWFESGETQP